MFGVSAGLPLCVCDHGIIFFRVCECFCEIPLGAVAPAGWGCPPVSWQSFGSHGNAAQDAPALGLWCSPPPEELKEREQQNDVE